MESHNGLTNGVNGTANISVVEHSTTTVEVKSIQTISSQTVQIQEEITQAGFVESVSQKTNESSSISSSIQQAEFVESVSLLSNETSSISSSIQQSAQLSEVVQQTAIQSPDVQQTVAQSPVVQVQEPVAQSPADEQPVAQSSAVQQSVSESPVVQQPVAQSLADVKPVAQSPDVQQPVVQISVSESPAVEQVAIQQPVPQSPAVQSPVVQQPEVKVVPTPASDTNVVGKSISLPGSQPGTSDFQVPVYAINAVDRIAQAEGFTNYVINYDRGSNFGDGFVAEIVRAKIVGSQLKKGVQQDTELVLVLKLPPENKARRETMGMNVFEREVTAYNEILPMFQKFQLDKGLKPGQGFVSFPKCYYASFDKEKDEAVIIMEDIRRKGYKMLNKYKTVDFEHAKAVLETVAQLHGLSLAMKDQCPGIFNKFKGLKDVMADGMLNDMMKSITITNCEKAIGTLEPHEENLKKKLRAFGENIFDIVQTCTNGELVEPYTVLNHGDCWTNNMMFKYQVCLNQMFHLIFNFIIKNWHEKNLYLFLERNVKHDTVKSLLVVSGTSCKILIFHTLRAISSITRNYASVIITLLRTLLHFYYIITYNYEFNYD